MTFLRPARLHLAALTFRCAFAFASSAAAREQKLTMPDAGLVRVSAAMRGAELDRVRVGAHVAHRSQVPDRVGRPVADDPPHAVQSDQVRCDQRSTQRRRAPWLLPATSCPQAVRCRASD